MLVTRFENLEIWKLGRVIAQNGYSDFEALKDFGFKDQVTRAGISIMNNISERFSKESEREFHQFLNIAKKLKTRFQNS